MSALTDKAQELLNAAQGFEAAQAGLQAYHNAVLSAHQEVLAILEGSAPTQPIAVVQPEAQPEEAQPEV
jgi:hypothetical protein